MGGGRSRKTDIEGEGLPKKEGGGGGLGQFANLREDLARKNGVLFLKGVGGGVGWGGGGGGGLIPRCTLWPFPLWKVEMKVESRAPNKLCVNGLYSVLHGCVSLTVHI